jgi:hypothetical protein
MGSDNPGLFVFVLDQSGSMAQSWKTDPTHVKAAALADTVNDALVEIANRCIKGAEGVSHRCDIAIIGYSTDSAGNPTIRSGFGGALAGRDIVSIQNVYANPLGHRVIKEEQEQFDEIGGLRMIEVEGMAAYWIEPQADGGTPMPQALARACEIVENWINDPEEPRHRGAFPPIVIHITDGQSTHGDPSHEAEHIRSLATEYGSVLLINSHIPDEGGPQIRYPAGEAELPDEFARLLFRMSSELPAPLMPAAQKAELPVREGSRLMTFNAGVETVTKLINYMSMTPLK